MDELRLCLVTDRNQTRGRDLVDVVAACARAGLPSVQVREKDLSFADVAWLCRRIRALRPAPGHVPQAPDVSVYAAAHFEKLDGKAIAEQSGHYKNIVSAAAQLHGWDTRFQGAQFSLNVLNIGSCGIKVGDETT